MAPSAIIRECSRRGVSLAAVGDSIQLRGRVDALGEGIRTLIRIHKSDILDHLRARDGTGIVHLCPESSPPSPPFLQGGLPINLPEKPLIPTTYNNNNQEKPNSPPSPPFSHETSHHEEKLRTESPRPEDDPCVLFPTSVCESTPPKGGLGGLDATQPFTEQSVNRSPPKQKGGLNGGLNSPKGGLGAAFEVPEESPWKPRPLPWRSVVGRWPLELRQCWGNRANELAEQGDEWPEDERQAFEDVNSGLNNTPE